MGNHWIEMSNKSSRAGHVPFRTCVICKRKAEKKKLMRFVLLDSDIVLDLNYVIAKRGYYICDKNDCLQKLEKRVNKILKSRDSIGR